MSVEAHHLLRHTQTARLTLAIGTIGLIASLVQPSSPAAGSGATFPGAAWAERTPAQLGLNEQKLNRFVANIGGSGVIVKDGYLVKSWGSPSAKLDWASAAKPVLSTLLFHSVASGKLHSVDAPVDPWWNNTLAQKDKAMSFRHLADMTSGYARGEAPGQAWAYNDYGIKLYCDTLTKVHGGRSPATMFDRLFAPLQLQDGTLTGVRGDCGIGTSPRDFARIGWLWLNKGNWNGTQIVPQSFFQAYQRADVPNTLPRTSASGADYLGVGTVGGGSDQFRYGPGIYGFNWWFNDFVGLSGKRTWPDAPADTYQANGHWNVEVVTVIPSLRMVVAAKGDWGAFAPGSSTAGMNTNLKLLAESVIAPAPTPTAAPSHTPTPAPGNVILSDHFNRPNNVILGNGWKEIEQSVAKVEVKSNALHFADTSNASKRPLVRKTFGRVRSGVIEWTYAFNWARTGADQTYYLYMQLGDSARMNNGSIDEGVGVNLVWGQLSGAHETLGTRRSGANNPVAVVSGPTTFKVRVDVTARTYAVWVNGAQVAGAVPFDHDVSLDTIRLVADGVNETSFSVRTFDSLKIRAEN